MPYNGDYYQQQQQQQQQQYYGQPPYVPGHAAQPYYPPHGQAQYPPQGPPQVVPLGAVLPQHVQYHGQPMYQNYHMHPQGPPQYQAQGPPPAQAYVSPPVQTQFPPPVHAQHHSQSQAQDSRQVQQLVQPQVPYASPQQPAAQYPGPHHPPQHAVPQDKSPALSRSTVSVVVPAKPPKAKDKDEADMPNLMISLADEYLAAACSKEMQTALANGQAQQDDYCKLVCTALGCMDTALRRYRYSPLKEARLRLQYARTLLEETDNGLDAESTLTKGVDLCERNKFFDLKYSMQVLLIRMLYRSRPKAALKPLDGFIEDVATYKHTSWEYVFRFLRANLSISMASHQDFVLGVGHLQKIMTLAQRKGDHSVFTLAAVTQALAHLRNGDADAISQAQTALAMTRQFQLSPEVNSMPQLQILLHHVDLCCAMQQYGQEQTSQKLSAMQNQMDQMVNDPSWQDNGEFDIPLSASSAQTVPLLGGGILNAHDGKVHLRVSWLPKKDVYTVGFLLSAVAHSHKHMQNDSKTDSYLQEGLAMLKENMATPESGGESQVSMMERESWRQHLQLQFLLQKAFLQCGRTEWDKARQTLSEAKHILHMLPEKSKTDLICLFRYLRGCISQGTGQVDKALKMFLSADLSIPSNCTMNTILIIRPPDHPSHHLLSDILANIEPYLNSSPNKHLLASRSLLISILPASAHAKLDKESLASSLLVKKHLGIALNIAKTIQNAQITALTLSVMSDKFFKGVVGEQAEKSARAGQNMAAKSGMKLWISVSEDALADTLERQGKRDEAAKWRQMALKRAGELPKELQRFEGAARADRGGDEEMDELA